MPSTHSNLLVHVIFSTKNRCKVISDNWQGELFAYIGGVLHDHDATLLEAGGIEDHVHLLIRAHPAHAISETVRHLKANSSRWISEQRKIQGKFQWQTGYGVFSVSESVRETLLAYIRNQRHHHTTQSFEQEYLALLKLHHIRFDSDYVFDEEIAG